MLVLPLAELARTFWIAFFVSAICAYPIWKALLRWKSRQTISQYAPEGHQAKQGTPTMGGLIINVGVVAGLIAATILGAVDAKSGHPTVLSQMPDGNGTRLFLAGFTVFVLFAIIGFIDDYVIPRLMAGKRGLGWKQKIVMQFVAAGLACLIVFEPSDVWKIGLGIFLILFFSNAYNFSDGLDALAGTLLLGLGLGLLGVAYLVPGYVPLAFLIVPMLGAVLPFLLLNAPPARVFMGDVGSLPIGALLGYVVTAALTLNAGNWSIRDPWVSFEAPVLGITHPAIVAALLLVSFMMIVELVPVPLQILSVKLRKKRLFPYTPIHHAFEKAGWKETRVTAMFALVQLVLSLLAIWVLIEAFAPRVEG